MSTLMETDPRPLTLHGGDRDAVESAARELARAELGGVDDARWIAAARDAWEALPVALRRAVRSFRRDSGRTGALMIRGLPVGGPSLSPTPNVAGSVQRDPTVSAAALMMVASGLGDPAAYRAEKSGALVQDVVPVPGQEQIQGNSGSVDLTLHNENAFHPHRPDFVMLLCLRADHDGLAGLRTACIRRALATMSEGSRDALFRDEFVTHAPPSFGSVMDGPAQHAVLRGAADDPDVQVDFAATRAVTSRGAQALAELDDALQLVADTHILRPGDLAVVDNRVAVHGRTAFRPRYDGQDRWLQRTFVLTDLRRTRSHRVADANVLVH